MTSNALSLAQVGVMKIPGVKSYLGIPESLAPPATDPSVKPGSFMENLRAGELSNKVFSRLKSFNFDIDFLNYKSYGSRKKCSQINEIWFRYSYSLNSEGTILLLTFF